MTNSSLPSGTVTFLFTDIEGSTKLAQQHPDRWETLRERHHAILQSAIDARNGYVFQIIGDAFCGAFRTAKDGILAALDAQYQLQNENWGETPIRVRMGLHTGLAEIHGMDYHGYLTLAKVQRVMSVAYGRQVLVSNASAELVHNDLPAGITLRDMKEHRLKGLPDPERLWQVVAPGLQQTFPPLQSLMEIPNNLPTQLTTFIGREKEVEQIKKRLEKNRLVTLTGSGGVGKTRLSIQVACELLSEYPNGTWLVELAPITEPALVTQTVCAALDVTPQGNAPVLHVLTDYLKPKKILLVVDNCEHLIDASAQLCEALLHTCPDLRIIASSREALGIEGENAYHVPSLSLPNPNDELQKIEKSEAVKLFMERASATLPEIEMTEVNAPVIAQICQRLDGIALAIELAASRVKILKVEQIALRLDDVFRLLTGGSRTSLPRQQTLRGTIDWSYNLLSEEERIVLRWLSVFIGGWTLEAAEAVCENPNILDVLTRLVDKSLVAVDYERTAEVRYYFLETIRQYLREKLVESGEVEQIRDRHLDYFLKLAQTAEPDLYGPIRVKWMQKLEDEHENIRAALKWSLQANIMLGQELTRVVWRSWFLNGHLGEGYEWTEKMLAATPGDGSLIMARLLAAQGMWAVNLGYSNVAKKLLEESIYLFRKLEDKNGMALSLIFLGGSSYLQSDYERNIELIAEGLNIFMQAGNRWGVSRALGNLGYNAFLRREFEQAQKFFEEGLLICKEIGDQEGIAIMLFWIATLPASLENIARVMELYEQALVSAKAVKSKPMTANILTEMGIAASYNGEYQRGKQLLEEALELYRKMGDQASVARALRYLGWTARLQGDHAKARSLYLECLQLSYQMKELQDIAATLIHIGSLMLAQGSPEKFARMLGMLERVAPDVQKTMLPFVQIETDKFIENAHATLDDEVYTTAWEAGQQMSLDEAVGYALKELQ